MLVAHKYVCGTLIGFMTFGEAAAQGPQFLYPIPGSQVTYNYYDTLNLSWTVPLRYPATLVYSLLCAAANVLENQFDSASTLGKTFLIVPLGTLIVNNGGNCTLPAEGNFSFQPIESIPNQVASYTLTSLWGPPPASWALSNTPGAVSTTSVEFPISLSSTTSSPGPSSIVAPSATPPLATTAAFTSIPAGALSMHPVSRPISTTSMPSVETSENGFASSPPTTPSSTVATVSQDLRTITDTTGPSVAASSNKSLALDKAEYIGIGVGATVGVAAAISACWIILRRKFRMPPPQTKFEVGGQTITQELGGQYIVPELRGDGNAHELDGSGKGHDLGGRKSDPYMAPTKMI